MSKTHEVSIHEVPADFAARAHVDAAGYEEMYRRSIEENEAFWAEQASCIDWIKPFSKVKDVSFDKEDLVLRWHAERLRQQRGSSPRN